jgi:FMN phosphatase YigB (HAD superfamily)
MAIQTVLFDVADTLLHKPGLLPAIRTELSRHGLDFAPAEIARTHRIVRELFTFPDKTGREFYLEFNARFLEALGVLPHRAMLEGLYESCSQLPWMPFADTACLAGLGCPVGIISNWDSSLREKLARHFACAFSPIVTSAEAGYAKPDVRLYQQALAATGLDPAEVALVGDSIHLDIVPALSLGIRAVLIDRDACYPRFNGDRIERLDALAPLLRRWEAAPSCPGRAG